MNQGIIGIYIPQCKADGSFEPMQCWGSTDYCWCVDKNGDEIPGTQTPPGNQEPNCNEQGCYNALLISIYPALL